MANDITIKEFQQRQSDTEKKILALLRTLDGLTGMFRVSKVEIVRDRSADGYNQLCVVSIGLELT
jgi:hypothetical protein